MGGKTVKDTTENQIPEEEIIIVSKKDDDFLDRTRRYFGEELLKKFRNSHVMIVGMGAIGNEVLKNLAPLGIGKFTIIDPDVVTFANLNRCVLFKPEDARNKTKKVEAAKKSILEWIPEPPTINVFPTIIQDVPLDIVESSNLVICGVDNDLARLHVNRMVLAASKPIPLINGAMGRNFVDMHVLIPQLTACLACGFTKEQVDKINANEVKKSCDEFFFEVQATFPAISTLTSIIGAFIATEAIKVLERSEPLPKNPLAGKYYRLDIRDYQLFIGKTIPNKRCVEQWCQESPKWSTNR